MHPLITAWLEFEHWRTFQPLGWLYTSIRQDRLESLSHFMWELKSNSLVGDSPSRWETVVIWPHDW